VAASAAVGTVPAHAAPTGNTPRSALIIIVNWAAGNGTPAAPADGMTPAAAAGQVGGTDVGWYQQVSYAQFPGWNAAAVGPYTINTPPLDTGGTCVNSFRANIQAGANQAAATAGFNVSNYSVVMYYFSNVPQCGWGGWTIGNLVWINGAMNTATTAHELGHTLALWHGHSQTCTNGAGTQVPLSANCQTAEYGDVYEVMGCCGPGSFSAIHKYDLGWMSGRMQTVPATGGTYTLQPLEAAAGGLQALRVVDGNETLWLEYRQPIGVDSWLSPASTNGVLIHRQLPDVSGPLGSYLLDLTPGSTAGFSDAPLPPGSGWTNPLGHMTITVNSAGPSGAVVTLTSNLISVPNVVGLDPASAKAALTAAGLKANLQSVVDPTCNHLGEVMSQSPAGGTLVNPGAVVTIRVGRPPAKPCP